MTDDQKHLSELYEILNEKEQRVYFDVLLIDDSLLTELVTVPIILKSSRYIEDLAASYGVSSSNISNPTPYLIERIAELYTLREAAMKRTHGNENGDGDGADNWERKRQIYNKELQRLLEQLTSDTFTGGLRAKKRCFPMSVTFYRG